MFFATRIAGPSDFATFYEALAIPPPAKLSAVSRFLDVSPASVKLWLSGKRCPPRAAVIALWHESHFGRAVTSAHSEYGETLARNYADSCTREAAAMLATIDALRAELDAVKRASATGRAVAMNEPVFDRPNGPPRLRSK